MEYIAPVPSMFATPAFVIEYITTEPALSYVAAAPTVYAAPAPVVEYGRGGVHSARACRVRDTSSFVPAPAVSYVATAVYATPASEMEYIALASSSRVRGASVCCVVRGVSACRVCCASTRGRVHCTSTCRVLRGASTGCVRCVRQHQRQ